MKQILSRVFLMAVAAVVLWSCGSDEDVVGDDGYNAENGKVANTKWTARNADYGIGDDWVSTLDETYNFYFYSTTEGLFYYGRKDNDSDFGSSSERTVAHFSYNVNGNLIELEYITEPLFSGFDRLTLNGNTLSVSGFEFTKDALDASDNSWLSTLHGTTGDCKWYHNLKNAVWIVGKGGMADYTSYDRTPWAMHDHTPNMVFVEDGVTRIGNQAFANPSIGEVELPSTLKEIGNYAFSGTTVSQVNLPNAIVKIGEGAFSDCSYLTNVYMPESVEEIGDYAFSDCKKASLSGTPALKRIGQGAFMGCTVTSWTDSEVLEEIGVAAFTDCGFSEVSLPNSLKTIGSLAFSDDGISTIRIGTGLTNVNGTPFWPKSSGSMYVNKNVPLELLDDIIDGDKVGGWTLYVPVGSKSAYSKAAYWKNFKRIIENSELAGDGTVPGENIPDEGEDEENGNTSYTGTIQGHDYVDLGLSVKWATCNVGASLPEQYGNYFCWGRTETSWDIPNLASYVPTDISGTDYDAAYEIWGNQWKTPNKEQFEELIDNCTFTAEKVNGNKVIKATSKINGQSILFPLAGYREGFYERGDTKFQTLRSGNAVCLMISEVFSSKNNYFICWYNSLEANCSNFFNLSNTIYSNTYQLVVRPITE